MAYPTHGVDVQARYGVDERRRLAGLDILRLTDSLGFGAFSAAWLHDRPSGLWRYLLVTPMLETMGPLWVHDRLLRAFRKIPLPAGITPLDISVIEPGAETAIFGSAPAQGERMLALDGGKTERQPSSAQDVRIEDFSITDGFVFFYRRLSDADRKRQRDPATVFDRKVRQLEAA